MFALCLSLNIEELVHIYAVEQHCFGPFFFSLSGFWHYDLGNDYDNDGDDDNENND